MTAQKATLSSAEADSAASEAAVKAADDNICFAGGSVARSKADLEKVAVDFERGQQLYDAKLIAKQDYDQRKYGVRLPRKAAVDEAAAHMWSRPGRNGRKLRASGFGAETGRPGAGRLGPHRRRSEAAQFLCAARRHGHQSAGRVGETVVPGIQNSAASTIMTIADMSLITAEVKVDETDIVNVQAGPDRRKSPSTRFPTRPSRAT